MKRIFLAIDIYPDEQFLKELEAIRRRIEDAHIKWVDTSLLHLTVRFFGDQSDEGITIISDAVAKSAVNTSSFRVSFSSLGVFKNANHPRVIWVGCLNPGPLQVLRKTVDTELLQRGIPPEEKVYSPHLTLGRIKTPPLRKNLIHLLDDYNGFDFYSQLVTQMILYESILKPQGPEYTKVMVCHLKEGMDN